MLSERKDLYNKVMIDDNKELDLIDTQIPNFEFDSYTTFVVPQFAEGRIDIISYIHYQNVNLWWMIAQANEIVDTTTCDELYMGRVLRIPDLTEYYSFYNANSILDEINEVFDTRTIT